MNFSLCPSEGSKKSCTIRDRDVYSLGDGYELLLSIELFLLVEHCSVFHIFVQKLLVVLGGLDHPKKLVC
jgi:hypothetical protein